MWPIANNYCRDWRREKHAATLWYGAIALIQQAIAQIMTEICDPDCSERRSGVRPGRSAHDAVHQAREYIRQTYTVAVDMDLAKFFDTVVVMCRVARQIHDTRGLRLIGTCLRAGVSINGRLHRTPHGSITSHDIGNFPVPVTQSPGRLSAYSFPD
jgi:retron-type reverse transcriptase